MFITFIYYLHFLEPNWVAQKTEYACITIIYIYIYIHSHKFTCLHCAENLFLLDSVIGKISPYLMKSNKLNSLNILIVTKFYVFFT